ncbi:MAG: cyclic nucleotide-binding domain-containing protein, partial [Gammaproteobacteria bacterium]
MGMGAAKKALDKKIFRDLIPINGLSPAYLGEIAQKAVVEELRPGRYLFKRGDRDNQSVYLLEGEVSLINEKNEVVGTVRGGSDASRHPLANHQPRQVSARVTGAALVVRIDTSLLDIMLTWDQSAGYEVVEIDAEDDDDWMTRMLQSQAFLKLPPANIQRLLMSMEAFPVKAGETIIEQGGDGDYFYLIKHGSCAVTRRPSPTASEVKVAELGDGDSFGEDALLSEAKRNATVTMLADGTLMRLAKKDFVQLLKEPLIAQASYEQATAMVADGAIWLDVRLPGEFENAALDGSVNMPLSSLRERADELDPEGRYIVCCDTGRRSASGSFVLSQRGYDVFVLRDGLMSIAGFGAAGSQQPADGPVPVETQPEAERQTAEVIALDPERSPKTAEDAEPDVAGDSAGSEDIKARYEAELAKIRVFRDKARDRLKAARERETALVEARDLAQVQSQALSDELKNERSSLRRSEQLLNELRAKLDAAQTESREQEARLVELETSLDAARQAETCALGELETLRARVDEIERQQAEQGASEREFQELRAEAARLRDQLAERERAASDAESAARTAGEAVERLQAEHAVEAERSTNLAAEREGLQTELAAAREQLTVAQDRAQGLEQDRSRLEQSLQSAQDGNGAEREQLQSELAAVREQLVAAQEHAQGLEQERSRLAETLQSAQQAGAEVEQLRQQQSELERALEEARASARQVETLQTELDAANSRLAERSQTQAQERGALEQALEAGQARITELEAAQGALEEERGAALRERDEMGHQLATEREQAQARVEALDEQLAQASADLEAALRQVGERDAAVQEQVRLQRELQDARERVRSLEDEQAASGRTATEISDELARLRAGEHDALAQVASLQAELQAAQQALEQARQREGEL